MVDFASQNERIRQGVKVRLTREGWQFLLMLSFIVFAAIIQNINLLILISGAFAGLLLLQWRLSKRTLVGLKVERFIPSSIEARVPFQVELRIQNPRKWLGGWLISVRESIVDTRRFSGKSKQVAEGVSLLVPHVYPESMAKASYECRIARRGRYLIEPTQLSTVFPFSLARGMRFAGLRQQVLVTPARGRLVSNWRTVLNLRGGGVRHLQQNPSNQSGSDGEFYGIRDYRSGDSPRFIHWRTSAKRSVLVVKQMERLEDVTLHVVLDLEQDSEEGELATEIAATILTELVNNEKPATFSIIGDSATRSPVFNRLQLHSALERLAAATPNRVDRIQLPEQECCQSISGEPMLVISSRNSSQLPDIAHKELVHVQRLKSSSKLSEVTQKSGANLVWLTVPSEKCFQMFVRK
jgi:uncharacterized protein (DUF58 family)